jgi:CBS domain-containing protein
MELKDIVKEPTVIAESATFRDALSAMMKHEVNVLMVIDEDGILIGEVSVSDLMDAIVPEYVNGDNMLENLATEALFTEAVRGAADTPVMEFMSADIDPVTIDDGLMEVAASAIAHQKARIPVVDREGRPIGIISRRGLKQVLAGALGV